MNHYCQTIKLSNFIEVQSRCNNATKFQKLCELFVIMVIFLDFWIIKALEIFFRVSNFGSLLWWIPWELYRIAPSSESHTVKSSIVQSYLVHPEDPVQEMWAVMNNPWDPSKFTSRRNPKPKIPSNFILISNYDDINPKILKIHPLVILSLPIFCNELWKKILKLLWQLDQITGRSKIIESKYIV